jgi:hypothetical protein
MIGMTKSALLAAALAATTTLFACAPEADTSGDAPAIESDALDVTTEGYTYNGWTQSASIGSGISSTFTRSSGDATRGGGACYVLAVSHITGSCSSDAQCTGWAQGLYGSNAYGYCNSYGACLARPGSQADYCVLNPNRTAGTVSKSLPANPPTGPDACYQYALGCMTKTAGPNTACGGTNQNLYMRFWWTNPYCIVIPPF